MTTPDYDCRTIDQRMATLERSIAMLPQLIEAVAQRVAFLEASDDALQCAVAGLDERIAALEARLAAPRDDEGETLFRLYDTIARAERLKSRTP
jgi:uncharacterized coiled-coil protein SlyX